LDEQVDRVLLEQRHYQTRIVFGAPHLRTLLGSALDGPPVPLYLPEELASKLPMFRSFKVRLIAEAHPREDQDEAHEAALRVLAIARLASIATSPADGG